MIRKGNPPDPELVWYLANSSSGTLLLSNYGYTAASEPTRINLFSSKLFGPGYNTRWTAEQLPNGKWTFKGKTDPRYIGYCVFGITLNCMQTSNNSSSAEWTLTKI